MYLPEPRWETVFDEIGRGDGMTFAFEAAFKRWPARSGSAWGFWTLSDSVIDKIAALDRTQIPIDRQAASVHQYSSNYSCRLNFDGFNPPKGSVVYVVYEWRPAALVRAKFKVQLDGEEVWISMNELRDSLAVSPSED